MLRNVCLHRIYRFVIFIVIEKIKNLNKITQNYKNTNDNFWQNYPSFTFVQTQHVNVACSIQNPFYSYKEIEIKFFPA